MFYDLIYFFVLKILPYGESKYNNGAGNK